MSVQYKSADGWKNISSSSNNAVDTVENGNMNPVTSNAVYDKFASIAVVDSVTNGDMHPVTSNAVYDLLTKYVGALNRDSGNEPFPTVSSVNNAVNPGFYIVTGPEDYGGVLVLGNHTNRLVSGNTWIWQIYFGTSGTLYSRQAINPSSMPPTSSDWTTWKTIATN